MKRKKKQARVISNRRPLTGVRKKAQKGCVTTAIATTHLSGQEGGGVLERENERTAQEAA